MIIRLLTTISLIVMSSLALAHGGDGVEGSQTHTVDSDEVAELEVKASIPVPYIPTRMTYMPAFDLIGTIAGPLAPVHQSMLDSWRVGAGPEIRLGARNLDFDQAWTDPDRIDRHELVLHPVSLESNTLRATIEYRAYGSDPWVSITFGELGDVDPVASTPIPLGGGWVRQQFTVVRPIDGEPIGKQLDMLIYETHHVEARSFAVIGGTKGDVNMDQAIDYQDLSIVAGNYAQSGDLDIEDGDTNLDGTVDNQDVINVLSHLDD